MITVASSPVHGVATAVGGGFTGIGLVFVLVGLLIRRFSGPFKGGERAAGRIVGYDTSTPGLMRVPGSDVRVGGATAFGAGMVYRPRVVFTTYEGTEVTATAATGTNPRPGKVGDVVTVYYQPSNPQRIRVDAGRTQRSCVEVGFVLFGGVVAAIGIAILTSVH